MTLQTPFLAKYMREPGIAKSAELPNTVYGRLCEAIHISGYSFERACSELEWILDHDRWKSVGRGFDDIDEFLATIDFHAGCSN